MLRKVQKNRLYKYQKNISPARFAALLARCKECGEKAYIRRGTFIDELVWGDTSYVCAKREKGKKKNDSGKYLYLFGMVRRDAKEYLATHKVTLPKQYPVNYTNPIYRHKIDVPFGGVDMNHAYWRIAYKMGAISENTYLHGLGKKALKSVRLSALSTMGKYREFTLIEDGIEHKKKGILVSASKPIESEDFQNLYKKIRYTCFRHMMKLRNMLGDDFICYQTDCIYFVWSEANRKLVRDYLQKEGLFGKDLDDCMRKTLKLEVAETPATAQ